MICAWKNVAKTCITKRCCGASFGEELFTIYFFSFWPCSGSFLEGPPTPLRLQDLLPVFYEDGELQGKPVVLGTGGFGTVELVRTGVSG